MATEAATQWAWIGLDRKTGERCSGSVFASNRDAARAAVAKAQPVVIMTLRQRSKMAARMSASAYTPKSKDTVSFFRGLATSTAAGLSVTNALDMAVNAARETGSSARRLAEDLYARVLRGESFPDALEKHVPSLGPTPAAVCAAGVASGTLAEMLDGLADTMERNHEIRSKLRSAMVYPILSLVIVLAVAASGVFYIIPNYAGLLADNAAFTGGDTELPQPTRAMMGLSDFATQRWVLLLPGIGVAIAAAVSMFMNTKIRNAVSAASLRLPGFGSLIRGCYTVTMTQMFALTLSAGVPLTKATELVTQAIPHRRMQRALRDAGASMVQGVDVAAAMAGQTPPLDPYAPQLAQQSASSVDPGRPWKMYGDRIATETKRRIDTIQQLIQPLMTILLGAILLVVALGITRPLLKIYESF